jgi:phosphohistidine phosphatase
MRRLVVVRHGKSAWPVGVPDRERPLADRGVRDAPRMGARIGEVVGRVDLAVVSPARRARETWELLGPALGEVGEVRREPRAYDAWGEELLDVVTELPDPARTVLILAHEPGVSELVLALAAESEGPLLDRVATKFPTCGVAVLSADRPWDRFVPGCARLDSFLTPRD